MNNSPRPKMYTCKEHRNYEYGCAGCYMANGGKSDSDRMESLLLGFHNGVVSLEGVKSTLLAWRDAAVVEARKETGTAMATVFLTMLGQNDLLSELGEGVLAELNQLTHKEKGREA